MDFKAELLARIQAGEKIDDLASELTKAINEASAEAERLRQEKEAKRKAEAELKETAIDNLLIALEDVVAAWDLGDDLIDALEHINPDEIVQEMDKLKDLMDKYEELLAAKPNLAAMAYDKPVKPKDPIQEFLNKYVR